MKAVRVHAPGGPEELRLEERPDPVPGPAEILVRIEACGVNYIDVYHRTGLYRVEYPLTPGQEAAGTVAAVGSSVTGFRPGDRVACCGVLGTYAELAVVPAERLVALPAGVSARIAAAVLLQGMTAHYLACSTRPLGPGDVCLVHAAAGGVGGLLVQVARRRGARVIATVSTAGKAALAREAGADEVIDYSRGDFADEARRLNGGRGVDVVYDSVGRDTFARGLRCLRPRGMMVLFGQSSGPVGPVDPLVLSTGGSLFLTRPALHHHIATREELLARAGEVLSWVEDGSLAVRIDRELPLGEAEAAHRRLEARESAGKLLLIP